jgi:hypothetical protein
MPEQNQKPYSFANESAEEVLKRAQQIALNGNPHYAEELLVAHAYAQKRPTMLANRVLKACGI